MFEWASAFNADLSNWDVSRVGDMSGTFRDASVFNGDLSKWNVASVTDITGMFNGASAFSMTLCGSSWIHSQGRLQDDMFDGTDGGSICNATDCRLGQYLVGTTCTNCTVGRYANASAYAMARALEPDASPSEYCRKCSPGRLSTETGRTRDCPIMRGGNTHFVDRVLMLWLILGTTVAVGIVITVRFVRYHRRNAYRHANVERGATEGTTDMDKLLALEDGNEGGREDGGDAGGGLQCMACCRAIEMTPRINVDASGLLASVEPRENDETGDVDVDESIVGAPKV